MLFVPFSFVGFVVYSRLRPDAKAPAERDDLADVIRVVVGDQQNLAQVRLTGAVRNGRVQIDLRAHREALQRRPIAAEELAGLAELVSPLGDLRTLPCHLSDPDAHWAGLDGFYAARLERT